MIKYLKIKKWEGSKTMSKIQKLKKEVMFGFCYDRERQITKEDIINKINELVDRVNELSETKEKLEEE